MNSSAIHALRKKFICSTLLIFFLVMLVMGTCINVLNIFTSHRQIMEVMNFLISTEGHLLERSSEVTLSPLAEGSIDEADSSENRLLFLLDLNSLIFGSLDDFSSEFRYSARYFTAQFDDSGRLVLLNTENIAELSDSKAMRAARRVYAEGRDVGRIGYYYYKRGETAGGNTLYAFVNCQAQIRTNLRILTITILIGVICFIISSTLVVLFSGHYIRPEIRNAKRQKQFITNASHELKTPLAVIRANTELEEMIYGESDWTRSTLRQIDRLSVLIQNLITIARAEEREDRSAMQEINASVVVDESIRPYESLAKQENKEFSIEITPDIRILADESKLRQLAALLIDNAFKYCDPNGKISFSLVPIRMGRLIKLSVSNSFAAGKNMDYSRFFDRFYRADSSRNVDRGGFGIGLSIAESICSQYGGSINASWKDGVITFTCMLPT